MANAPSDELSGAPTHYLFMEHGKLLSNTYLFTTPLHQACQRAGLVYAQGRATITPYQLRHTVGTQLAERGAKLHTIMKILGHNSVSMALLYAQIAVCPNQRSRGSARLPERAWSWVHPGGACR